MLSSSPKNADSVFIAQPYYEVALDTPSSQSQTNDIGQNYVGISFEGDATENNMEQELEGLLSLIEGYQRCLDSAACEKLSGFTPDLNYAQVCTQSTQFVKDILHDMENQIPKIIFRHKTLIKVRDIYLDLLRNKAQSIVHLNKFSRLEWIEHQKKQRQYDWFKNIGSRTTQETNDGSTPSSSSSSSFPSAFSINTPSSSRRRRKRAESSTLR